MDNRELSQLVMQCVALAISGDSERSADTLDQIGHNATTNQMFGVCCSLAEAGKHFIAKTVGEEQIVGFWMLEELKPGVLAGDPAEAFAARFQTAYGNDDTDTCLALFQAAFESGAESYVASIASLLANTAGLGRMAEQALGLN